MKAPALNLELPPLLRALDDALLPTGVASLDPSVPDAVWRAALVDPAASFLARPGKDLRARFVAAGWTLAGGDPAALPPALAGIVEMIHAGSLIVDDVEDGSETRRGGPALHHLVGTPLAINTGSWMYFWALAELARLALPGALELAVATLVRCHQGQALDLVARVHELALHDVPAVVAATTRLKTGALCRFAIELGAIAAGAPPERRAPIGALGEAAGSALQMLDDLGCIASEARHAKACEDLRAGRPTWPWAWLAQHDPFAWARLVGQLRAVVAGTGDPVALATALAAEVEPAGRAYVRAALATALDTTRAALGASAALDTIAADLGRMEALYG